MGGISITGIVPVEQRLEEVIAAVTRIRIPKIIEEYQLQDMINVALKEQGLTCKKEYRLGPRNRIDFLCNGGIGIEVKKGKPNSTSILKQLERYAMHEQIEAIILVIERNIAYLPSEINGKPCRSIGLNKLWGIAL
ncbi:hypothetical protein EV210_101194 [Anaerospora hongkongensis]|uniref:DUF4143 domain-containing protein n=1 Tax=Anaerospora hongkongensis TaxID=244830 RepID=A0A4R1Q4I5_9FIRM|nr:hypothetical protein [Anaerospora hongkongensis]TCL39994.1 hypothetical protein EV210_101194 [Anaerospora hongkongensis]